MINGDWNSEIPGTLGRKGDSHQIWQKWGKWVEIAHASANEIRPGGNGLSRTEPWCRAGRTGRVALLACPAVWRRATYRNLLQSAGTIDDRDTFSQQEVFFNRPSVQFAIRTDSGDTIGLRGVRPCLRFTGWCRVARLGAWHDHFEFGIPARFIM